MQFLNPALSLLLWLPNDKRLNNTQHANDLCSSLRWWWLTHQSPVRFPGCSQSARSLPSGVLVYTTHREMSGNCTGERQREIRFHPPGVSVTHHTILTCFLTWLECLELSINGLSVVAVVTCWKAQHISDERKVGGVCFSKRLLHKDKGMIVAFWGQKWRITVA